jgi:hypothetical protein
MTIVEGKDVIPIPMTYYDEFHRDPMDSLLKYGSLPQRARAPWFTNVQSIEDALCLPDQVIGPKSRLTDPRHDWRSLEAAAITRDPDALIEGVSEHFFSRDPTYWHVHVDLALNKKRHGDAAGIAMGRISESYVEKSRNALHQVVERVVRSFDIPLVAQIVAPVGDQIYLGSIVRFILQLREERGFNITSFSFDGFQSADSMQQLMLAGLVGPGMVIDQHSGEITGLPKPWSVDGRNTLPYRELLEAANERRIRIARYGLLKKELRELEVPDKYLAPDHPFGGSKDVADPCAGVVGYLSVFGHAELDVGGRVVDREYFEEHYDLPTVAAFGVEDDPSSLTFSVEGGDAALTFDLE